MAFYSLASEQKLPITLEEAWDFFSSPKNLDTITPPDMKFSISNKVDSKMFAGQIITYKMSPFPLVKINWMTEITTVKDHEYFIDEQRFGPYALWHHKHSFKAIEGGVLITDLVNYKMPLGILGTIAHALFVKNKLKGIFSYRTDVLEKMFGKL